MLNDDRWKDELLAEPRFSGLQLLKMPQDRLAWINRQTTVFVQPSRSDDCLVNLLHPDNADLAREMKRRG